MPADLLLLLLLQMIWLVLKVNWYFWLREAADLGVRSTSTLWARSSCIRFAFVNLFPRAPESILWPPLVIYTACSTVILPSELVGWRMHSSLLFDRLESIPLNLNLVCLVEVVLAHMIIHHILRILIFHCFLLFLFTYCYRVAHTKYFPHLWVLFRLHSM